MRAPCPKFLIVLGLSSACARVVSSATDVPADVAYVVILELNEAGGVTGASPISHWRADEPLPIYGSEGHSLAVLAWTEAQLDGLDHRDPSGVAVEVVPSDACTTRLPSPSWFATLTAGGQADPRDPISAPHLSAPELSICHPEAQLSLAFGTCPSSPLVVEHTGSCALVLHFAGELGDVPAIALPDGGACLAAQGEHGWRCRHLPPSELASDTAECDTPLGPCTLSVFEVPADFPYERFQITVRDVEPYGTPLSHTFHVISPYDYGSGWARDLEILGPEILVSTTGSVARSSCSEEESGPGELLRFDLETGRLAGTSSTPPCLMPIHHSPSGVGFYGVYADGLTFRLGRFERDGRLTRSVPITAGDGSAFGPQTAQAMYMDDLSLSVITAFAGVASMDRIYGHETDTLRQQGELGLSGKRWARAASPNTQAVVLGGNNTLSWVALGSFRLAFEVAVPVDTTNGVIDSIYYVNADGSDDGARVRVLARPPTRLYTFSSEGKLLSTAAPLDLDRVTLDRMVRWHKAKIDIVLGHIPGGDTGVRTVLLRYDRNANHFLPGWWVLGEGLVSQAIFDADDRLVLLFPWSAQVLRLSVP